MKSTLEMSQTEYLLYCIDEMDAAIEKRDYHGIAEWSTDAKAVINELLEETG